MNITRIITLTAFVWASVSVNAQNLVWHNPQSESFHVISGQGWPSELKGTYNRFPDRCEGKVPSSVWGLSQQSAGLYFNFKTDSPTIKVRFILTGGIQMPHMPATGVSGVDLYSTDERGCLRWHATGHNREFGDTATMTYKDLSYTEGIAEGYEFKMYLPLYNHVEWMEIGVEEGSFFKFLPASTEKPIVVYGTSIAQGACATRPGMAWTNIVQREMDAHVVNLGFSGSGKMEPEVFSLLSEIDASVYVIDCMANLDYDNGVEKIYERTINGVHILRARTDAPIILVEHAGFSHVPTSVSTAAKPKACNVELDRAFSTLIQEGVRGLYLIPNSENAYQTDEMVEGGHPNDIGMMHQATVTEKYIRIAVK